MSFNVAATKVDDYSVKLRTPMFIKEQTKKLELDNEKMEERLRELKLAMSRERAERERSKGGAFWQSGQVGSLSTYAKDLLKNPVKSGSVKQRAEKTTKMLKDEPIVVADRVKGPGTTAFIAQRTGEVVDEKRHRCGQCEEKAALVSCMECGEDYCAGCFAAFHLRGALKKHRSTPISLSRKLTPRSTSARPRSSVVTAAGDVAMVNNRDKHPVDSSSATDTRQTQFSGNGDSYHGSSENTSSSLLNGTYNEEENAAAFQEAIRAWREQPSSQKTVDLPKPKIGVELGTSTDNEKLEVIQPPVQINFTSSLSYAERLLLKVSRRTEAPVSAAEARPLDDSRNTQSRVDAEAESPEDDDVHKTRRSLSVRSASPLDDAQPLSDFQPRSDMQPPSDTQPPSDDYRSESRVSIIELTEMDDPQNRFLDVTSTYNVSNSSDDPPMSPSSRSGDIVKPRRSAFTKSAKVPDGLKFSPRPPANLRGSSEIVASTDEQAGKNSPAVKESSSKKNSVSTSQLRSSRKTSSSRTDVFPEREADKPTRSSKPSESVKLDDSSAVVNFSDREQSTTKSSSRSSSNVVSSKKISMAANNEPSDLLFVPAISSRENVRKSVEASSPSSNNIKAKQARQINSALVTPRQDFHDVQKQTTRQSSSAVGASHRDNDVEKETTRSINSAVGTLRSDTDAKKQATQKSLSVANTPRGGAAVKSGGSGQATSRPSSRVSSNYEGVLTKIPSEALHDVAAQETSLPSQDLGTSDLGEYFTIGLKASNLPGNSSARGYQSGRQSAASTPRPTSARIRVSNKLYQVTLNSWKPDTSLAVNVASDQAEPILRDVCSITENLLDSIPPDESDASSTAMIPSDQKQVKPTRKPIKSQYAFSNVNTGKVKPTRVPQAPHSDVGEDKGVFGPWSVSKEASLEELPGELKSEMIHRDERRFSIGRSVTPNMMLPRRSIVAMSTNSQPLSSRAATPSSGRESRMIIVDGDDLSTYDDEGDDQERANNDIETLAQLDREITPLGIEMSTGEDTVEASDNDSPTAVSHNFDLASKLRESLLMYDFEEMEAQLMEQHQVTALK